MIKMINEMMQSLTVFKVGTWITVIFTILLIILLFMKTSRDERGRAIIGTASIYSTIVFIVLVNILAKISLNIEVNYVSMSNCIQWIYNIVIMVESIVIIVLKKIRWEITNENKEFAEQSSHMLGRLFCVREKLRTCIHSHICKWIRNGTWRSE